MVPFGMTISLANPIKGVANKVIFGYSINSLSKALLKMILTELLVSTSVLATLTVTTFNVIIIASSWAMRYLWHIFL